MRFCIFCGIAIPQDAKYCHICGKEQPLVEELFETPQITNEAEQSADPATGITKLLPKSPIVRIAIGAGLFLALIAILTGVLIMIVKK